MAQDSFKEYGRACAAAVVQHIAQGGDGAAIDDIIATIPVPTLPADWCDAVADAISVLSTINVGPPYAIKRGDELVFWQRQEWIDWARDEVLPKLRALPGATPGNGIEGDAGHPA